ncbi:phospholipid-transporting ATPase ABCA3-like isoform X3 [Dermacentor albipictus]|uniref:phospholipid-transporting ATPase ABCA3-like isoform X3 n=1 Tax=Dermacentor albipictus TaxID=60249 RepID=UPI0031FC3C7E
MACRQLVVMLWRDTYVRRFRGGLLSVIAQTALALLVIYTLNRDIGDEPDTAEWAGDSQDHWATTRDTREARTTTAAAATSTTRQVHGPWNARDPATKAMPARRFEPSHPLDGWSSGPGAYVDQLCYVTDKPFFEPVARRAASILNITKVTRLDSKDELTSYVRKAQRAPPGSLIAVVFSTPSHLVADAADQWGADDNDATVGGGDHDDDALHSRKMDYEVRVHGIEFDVNVRYRRFLVLPSTLNLRTFSEMTYLLPVQYAVETAYLEAISKEEKKSLDYEVVLRRFPYPSLYPEDFPTNYCRAVIRFVVAFWLPFILLVVHIVDERASGMRQQLRLYGVRDATYWLSHYLGMIIMVAVLGAFALAFLYVMLADDYGNVYIAATNPGLVYLVLLCFGSALAVHAMLLSLFFASTRLAGLVATMYWFLSLLLPYLYLQNPYGFGYYLVSRTSKLMTSALPGMFLHWCWMVIERLERFEGGAGFSNFASPASTPDNVTVLHLMIVSVLSSVVLVILIWYIDNVTNCNRTKTARPFYFPFRKFENQVVMNDVSVNVFSKQITVLLAPPGCGKTTIMRLITGSVAPNAGTITVGPYDVIQNGDGARSLLAYCPADNILFNELTVEEHLTFFGSVKGIPRDTLRSDVSRMMRDIGLAYYRLRRTTELPVSAQRLLCTAIALMPYPNVQMILLDEATCAMDPHTRRETWEMLFKVRRYKGVFLTTSDFAEAEALADRLVVLQHGELHCVGSPEYIKTQFGMGYMLRLSKGTGYQDAGVQSLIRKHSPSAEKVMDKSTSVQFRLTGNPEMISTLMRDLFYELEAAKSKLGIAKMDLMVTTLEDILQGISDRLPVPGAKLAGKTRTMSSPISEKGSGIRTEGRNEAAGTQAGNVQVHGIEHALQSLRNRTVFGPVTVTSRLHCLFHKRFLNWTRTSMTRSMRWLLPAALLLLGGYFESSLLAPSAGLDVTLAYTVRSIVGGGAMGFCGATKGGRFKSFVEEHMCAVLEDSDVRLESVDLTDVNSQLLALANRDVYAYMFLYQMGVVSNEPDPRVTLWYNGQNPHSALLALNLLHTAVLRNLTGDYDAAILLTNTPDNFQSTETADTLLSFFREFEMHSARRQNSGYVVHAVLVRVLCAVFVPAALCYHAAHFVVTVLGERMSGAKHLQLMTGLGGALYWLGNLLFDACMGVIHAVIFTAATVAFRTFLDWQYINAIFILFLAYSLVAINLAYLASFWFENAAKAFYTMTAVYLSVGVLGAFIAAALYMVQFSRRTKSFPSWFLFALSLSVRWAPTYAVTRGLTKLILLRKENLICLERGLLLTLYCKKNAAAQFTQRLKECCPSHGGSSSSNLKPLSLAPLTGFLDVFGLLLEGCFCFALVSFLDSDLLQRLWSRIQGHELPPAYSGIESTVDADVVREERLVDDVYNQRDFDRQALLVRGLSKAYGFFRPRFAVDNVSFAVRSGECLGLVGALGTGKSTLLGVLGGELFPTAGDAYMSAGTSLTRSYRQWMQDVGYVPYGWGLLDTLTAREMACLLAMLRGVRDVPGATACALQAVELDDPDAPIASYGAGAKTQLSLALALTAFPKLCLLDLPDLDAPSRLVVRRVLDTLRAGATVVLACEHLQHYAEVCDRIAILVAGRIECIGSVKELTDKYCRGTTITVYTFPDRKCDLEHQRFIVMDMTEHFPNATLVRCYEGRLEFRLSTPSGGIQMNLCEMFDRLLYLKRKHKFHIFYVSETTLDQIFVSLGRKHAGLTTRS